MSEIGEPLVVGSYNRTVSQCWLRFPTVETGKLKQNDKTAID